MTNNDEKEADFNKAVGKRIKHIRELLGFSIEEIASDLNITRQTLSNYESGKTPLRSLIIRKLSEMYNIPSDWIVGKIDDVEINYSNNDYEVNFKEKSIHIPIYYLND